MIYADHIHNTALLGFHPDFLREQNDETPYHQEELDAVYQFDMSDTKWAGVFLGMIVLLFLQMVIWPIVKYISR